MESLFQNVFTVLVQYYQDKVYYNLEKFQKNKIQSQNMTNKHSQYLWQEVNHQRGSARIQTENSTATNHDEEGDFNKFVYVDPVQKYEVVVEIPKSVVGVIFGKGRENLKKLEKLFCVEIEVGEQDDGVKFVPLTIVVFDFFF